MLWAICIGTSGIAAIILRVEARNHGVFYADGSFAGPPRGAHALLFSYGFQFTLGLAFVGLLAAVAVTAIRNSMAWTFIAFMTMAYWVVLGTSQLWMID